MANRTIARIAAAGCIIALTVAAAQAAMMGTSSLYVRAARSHADHATRAQLPPALRTRSADLAAQSIALSLALTPRNPWALEQAGVLQLMRVRTSGVAHEAMSAAQEARARLREAIRARPTSPFLWSDLSLAKLYLGENDAELHAALLNAAALGPWEPAVQEQIVLVGLAAWHALPTPARDATMRALMNGAARNGERMLQLVKAYGRLDLVCGSVQYSKMTKPDCPAESR